MNILTITEIADRKRLEKEDNVVENFQFLNDYYHFSRLGTNPKLDYILKIVCEAFDTTPEKMKKYGKRNKWCFVRYIYYYLARKWTSTSYDHIAERVGRKNWCVINGFQRVQDYLDNPASNPSFEPIWNILLEHAPSFLIPEHNSYSQKLRNTGGD